MHLAAKDFFEGAELELYVISLSYDGDTVQPDGSVLIQLPIDDEHAELDGTVYHVVSNGEHSKVDATYENQSYYFRTTHFINYLIVYEKNETNWQIPLALVVAICAMVAGAVVISKIRREVNS